MGHTARQRYIPVERIDRDAYERAVFELVMARLGDTGMQGWLNRTQRSVVDVCMTGAGDETEIAITLDEPGREPPQRRYAIAIWSPEWETEIRGSQRREAPWWLAEHSFDGGRIPGRYSGRRYRFHVPVDEIDERAYERDVIEDLDWILGGEWERFRAQELRLEVLGSELEGSAPDTQVVVRYRAPWDERGSTFSVPLWRLAGEQILDDGTRVRPTPHKVAGEISRRLLRDD